MEVRSKVSGMCVHKCKVKAMLNADCKKERVQKWQSQVEPSLFEQSITGARPPTAV